MGWRDRFGLTARNQASGQPATFRSGLVEYARKIIPGGHETKAVMGVDDAFARLLELADPNVLATPTQFFYVYRRSSAVAIPINLIAESFAQVQLVLRNMKTDDVERTGGLLDLLRRPHALFPRSLFLETAAKNYLIAGESPIVALGALSRPPVMLQPVSPKNMIILPDFSTGLPHQWKITGRALKGDYITKPLAKDVTFIDGPDRELKVIRSFSTDDDSLLRGQSKLVSAAKDVWQQLQGADYNLSLLRQGGRTSLVFHFKNNLSPEVFEDRAKQLIDQVEGVANAGRVLITHGGDMDLHEAKGSNRDMEYQKGMAAARNVVAQTYKVPLVLMTTDAATFSNLAIGRLALWDDAILPLAGTLLGGIGEWLLPRYGLDPAVWELTLDKMAVEALRTRLLEEMKTRMAIGVEGINEVRKSMPGLKPVEGGDEILVSGLQQPLSAVSQDTGDVTLPPAPAPVPDPKEGNKNGNGGE